MNQTQHDVECIRIVFESQINREIETRMTAISSRRRRKMKKCENQIVSGRLDRLDLRITSQPVPDTLAIHRDLRLDQFTETMRLLIHKPFLSIIKGIIMHILLRL